jgi:hypothetical protein
MATQRWDAVLGGVSYVIYRFGIGFDKRRAIERQRRSALAAYADYEHHLWMLGDSRGFCGRYPPAA